MRAAMRQKMKELDAQQPGAAAPTATVPPPKPAPKKTSLPPAQATKPTPAKTNAPTAHAQKPAPAPKTVAAPESTKTTAAPVVVAPSPVDPEATAKEREAMRKKMQELQAQPTPEMAVRPPAGTVPPMKPAPQPKAAPPVQAATPAPPPAQSKPAPKPESVSSAPPPTQPVVIAPAPTAVPAPAPATQAPTPAPQAPVAAQPEPAPAATPSALIEAERAAQQQAVTTPKAGKKSKKTAMTPAAQLPGVQGPPLPISADKQKRLADLLGRYQADEITPAQYHQERAKILAEP